MAENTPNVPGAPVPPPRPSDAKVQPKKETVRINLPPKPTASATIKLPTLPAAAPPPPPAAAAPKPPGAVPPSAIAPPPGAGAPKPPTPPAPGAAGSRVAGAPAAKAPAPAGSTPPPPTAARRPAPAPAVASISGMDKGLAIAAAIVSVIALGSVVYLGWFLANQPAV